MVNGSFRGPKERRSFKPKVAGSNPVGRIESLQVRRTAHEGQILKGTKTDHGEPDAGRVVPVPATLAWMLEAQINLNGPDCELIFTTPRRRLWRAHLLPRPLEARPGSLRPRHPPHKCRHSYVTHLRAASVNDADLAEIAGHRVETMLARYTHAVGESFPDVRGSFADHGSRTRQSRIDQHGLYAATVLPPHW